MGMAVLIARYLQLDDDPLLEESLKKYLDYFIVNYMTEIQAQYIMTCKEIMTGTDYIIMHGLLPCRQRYINGA